MKFHFIAGAVYVLVMGAISGAPLDDKIKVFEAALKDSPQVADKSPAILRFGSNLTVKDLDMVVQRNGGLMQIENIVGQLMMTHPSQEVQKTGSDLLQELETEKKARIDAFDARATDVLAKVQEALNQAKKPADLDQILKDLQTLQPTPGSPDEEVSSALYGKISMAFQYVTQWQDYLSGMNSGNQEQAVQSLCALLNRNNQDIYAPIFFLRSDLLDRLALARSGNFNPPQIAPPATPTEAVTDPDVVLAKIKSPNDFEKMWPELLRVSGPNSPMPIDWSFMTTLDKTRRDAEAGIPVAVDIRAAIVPPYWGDNISRIVAMELLAILPYYFGTQQSNPPKPNETLVDYLDRLMVAANAEGNLALLQQVVAIKVAAATSGTRLIPTMGIKQATRGIELFLAGLSQDAAGQYTPAVISYENALKDPYPLLPAKIVGDRLAAIKEAHPTEFEKGWTVFLTPEPVADPLLGMYQVTPLRRRGTIEFPVTILPIPMTISIPARAVPSGSSMNATSSSPPDNTK